MSDAILASHGDSASDQGRNAAALD